MNLTQIPIRKGIGVKEVTYVAMNRGKYCEYRGWELPEDENGDDEGYLIEYLDSPNSNHPNHENYISWSPKDVFDKAYRPTDGLTYGLAIEALKKGYCIARVGWDGHGMYVFKQVPAKIDAEIVEKMQSLPDSVKEKFIRRGQGPSYENQMAVVKPDGTVDSWVASSSDTFAEDWVIVG